MEEDALHKIALASLFKLLSYYFVCKEFVREQLLCRDISLSDKRLSVTVTSN